MDGANAVQEFFHITIPCIRNVVLVTTLISMIWTINDFETPWLLTGGGPGYATSIISVITWRYAFGTGGLGHIGRASASSLFIIPLMLIIMIPLVNSMIHRDSE